MLSDITSISTFLTACLLPYRGPNELDVLMDVLEKVR